ncbi:MAG: hypothetical protein ISN64_02980 [Rickettsia sp.]|nr:hypothetical protein [Rickettsia sp.]
MLSSFDTIILVSFLICTAIVGFKHKIKSISDFAVGDRKFSNFSQIATIVATCMGGNTFNSIISLTYSEGLFYIIAILGETISLALLAIFLIPKMQKMLNYNSVAEAIGSLYGNHIRIFVAIIGIIAMVGTLSIQLKIFGKVFSYISNFDPSISIICASALVTLYSSKGGIRSVTYTDIVQFLSFAIAIPVITISLWKNVNMANITIEQNDKFNLNMIFDLENKELYDKYVFFFFFLAIPPVGADMYQRILLGSNIENIRKNFLLAGIIFFILRVIIAIIPVLLHFLNPNLEEANLIIEIITNYAQSGIRGLIILGIISMVMSTADSKINAASVLIVNDCFLFLKNFSNKIQIFSSNIITIIIGALGTLLAFSNKSIFDIAIASQSFNSSIVSPLVLVSILGFRTKSIIFLSSMIITLTGEIIFLFIEQTIMLTAKNIAVFFCINIIIFFLMHYIFVKDKNLGWTKHNKTKKMRLSKFSIKSIQKTWFRYFKGLNLLKITLSLVPQTSKIYTITSLYFISTLVLNIYSQHQIISIFPNKMLLLYELIIMLSLSLASYHAFSNTKNKDQIFSVIWLVSNFFILFFSSTLFLLITNFSYIQLIIFVINIIISLQLLRTKTTIVFLILSTFLTVKCYKTFFMPFLDNDIIFPPNTLYILFTISLAIIFFNLPKEDKILALRNILLDTKRNLSEKNAFLNQTLARLNLNEKKSEQLIQELNFKNSEIKNLQNIKAEFINNLQHETHTPITGIASMAEALYDAYHQLNEKERQKYIIDIAYNAKRLISFVDNMIDLSKLSSMKYQLNLENVSLKKLIFKHVDICKKLHIYDQGSISQEFVFDLDDEDEITIECDKYYVGQLFNNIIKNALIYSQEGFILIKCKKLAHNLVEFSCRDEGKGIPNEELHDIFGAFVVSSQTKSNAGGRGVGLSLCKKITDSHNGEIWISSNNPSKGSTCFIQLPIIQKFV